MGASLFGTPPPSPRSRKFALPKSSGRLNDNRKAVSRELSPSSLLTTFSPSSNNALRGFGRCPIVRERNGGSHMYYCTVRVLGRAQIPPTPFPDVASSFPAATTFSESHLKRARNGCGMCGNFWRPHMNHGRSSNCEP